MPAKSERQRRFFGAELHKQRMGMPTKTNMGEDEMAHMASSVMPKRKGSHRMAKMKKMAGM